MAQKEVPAHYPAAEYKGGLDDGTLEPPYNGEQFARTADLAPHSTSDHRCDHRAVTGWTPLRSLEQLLPLLQFFALQIFEPLGWLWRWPLARTTERASTVSNW